MRSEMIIYKKGYEIMTWTYANYLRGKLIELIDNPESKIDDLAIEALDWVFQYKEEKK